MQCKMFAFIRFFFFVLIFRSYLTKESGGGVKNRNLTRTECTDVINSTRYELYKTCCHVKAEDDPSWKQCSEELERRNFPTKDNSIDLVHLSWLAGCIFAEKDYIKSNDRLNMKKIRADARRLYGNDSRRMHFMIDMYKDCGRRSAFRINEIKKEPDNDEILNSMHKPYFAFILKCIYYYSHIKCPYFRWEGLTKTNAKTCADYAAQCKKQY